MDTKNSTMVRMSELLEPTKFKITLFLMLIIPCVSFILLTFAFLVQNVPFDGIYFDSPLFLEFIVVTVLSGLILSYLSGSILDHFIKSERVKIIIAVFSGIISILIIYTLFKMVTEPVICDPVHNPNQTICDPVHQPSHGADSVEKVMDLEVDGSAVKSSFKECLQNLEL
jgi:hypothetical protein